MISASLLGSLFLNVVPAVFVIYIVASMKKAVKDERHTDITRKFHRRFNERVLTVLLLTLTFAFLFDSIVTTLEGFTLINDTTLDSMQLLAGVIILYGLSYVVYLIYRHRSVLQPSQKSQ
jgi:uncharacterized membrane protein YesL